MVAHLIDMGKRFFGLTREDVRRLAFQLAEAAGLETPFTDDRAGRDWFDRFMKRHPELSIRKPELTSLARARGFNAQSVGLFFDLLSDEMSKKNFAPARIFNVDETGLTVNPTKVSPVVAVKGQRQVGMLSAQEMGKWITAVCCMNATGTFVPPLLIFPRKNFSELLMRGAPVGALGKTSLTGWITQNFSRCG